MIQLGYYWKGRAIMQDHTTNQPNIIIMYADDLGFGDVSCYGADGYETPSVDRLRREGRGRLCAP